MFSLFRREVQESKGLQSPIREAGNGRVDEVLAGNSEAALGIVAQVGNDVADTGSGNSGLGLVVPDGVIGVECDHGASKGVDSATAGSELPLAAPVPADSSERSAAASDGSQASDNSALSSPGSDAEQADASEESRTWVEDALELSSRVRSRKIRGKRLEKPETGKPRTFTGEQRILLLDAWLRSGLPAGDFAALIGISKHTLYLWKKNFEELGPAGLAEQPRVERRGSRLPEVTKRTILLLKKNHPEWGCQRISDMLLRGPALPASPKAVSRVLHEAGYEFVESPTRPHPQQERRFERAKPNQLWQTDLFTFVLKRQNRRLYLAAFMDDHSRFVVSYGLHASASTALVLEALEAGISSYGPPEEVLTDNGPQYITWRGKSHFTKRLEQRGIRQIVARPRRPQTLGKVERFWGTLWREFLEVAVFTDLQEARSRIGLFIDHYNFQRTHLGIDGLTPADRYFGAASDVARTLKERVAARDEVCQVLSISPSTLRRWGRERNNLVELRGRRVGGYSVESRNAVIAFLAHVTGPAVGVAALCCLFTDLPRCLLQDLLTRYRRVWRRRYRRNGLQLEWRVAGAVWAMDHSQPCQPIDGVYPCLFAVRDLGSHRQLAWEGVPGPTAASTKAILERLFAEQGRPLVIKCDNGSAFIALELVAWLTDLGIVLLYSPPRYPQYNGALERFNGVLKQYTQYQATREGHEQRWTSANVAEAMTLANQISRPWGHRGPSPEQAWKQRLPISDDERRHFQERLESQRQLDRVALGLDFAAELSRENQARLDRNAIPKVLVELGYLDMSQVTRPAPKAKRRSKDEMRQRLERNADRVPIEPIDVSFLNVDSANPAADLPCPTLTSPSVIESTTLSEVPAQREIALQSQPQAPQPTEVGAPKESVRAEAMDMSNELSASTASADQELARPCASEPLTRSTDTFAAGLAWVMIFVRRVVHWFDVRTTGTSCRSDETHCATSYPETTLASAPRHDTMRGERERDVGDCISSGTDLTPMPHQSDPANVIGLRRLFTPLLSKPKASKIT